jgi:hypothetical protein
MDKQKLMIENLELCAKLMANCANAMREMGETIAKYERDVKVIVDYAEKQRAENEHLDKKLTNILNGIGVNK